MAKFEAFIKVPEVISGSEDEAKGFIFRLGESDDQTFFAFQFPSSRTITYSPGSSYVYVPPVDSPYSTKNILYMVYIGGGFFIRYFSREEPSKVPLPGSLPPGSAFWDPEGVMYLDWAASKFLIGTSTVSIVIAKIDPTNGYSQDLTMYDYCVAFQDSINLVPSNTNVDISVFTSIDYPIRANKNIIGSRSDYIFIYRSTPIPGGFMNLDEKEVLMYVPDICNQNCSLYVEKISNNRAVAISPRTGLTPPTNPWPGSLLGLNMTLLGQNTYYISYIPGDDGSRLFFGNSEHDTQEAYYFQKNEDAPIAVGDSTRRHLEGVATNINPILFSVSCDLNIQMYANEWVEKAIKDNISGVDPLPGTPDAHFQRLKRNPYFNSIIGRRACIVRKNADNYTIWSGTITSENWSDPFEPDTQDLPFDNSVEENNDIGEVTQLDNFGAVYDDTLPNNFNYYNALGLVTLQSVTLSIDTEETVRFDWHLQNYEFPVIDKKYTGKYIVNLEEESTAGNELIQATVPTPIPENDGYFYLTDHYLSIPRNAESCNLGNSVVNGVAGVLWASERFATGDVSGIEEWRISDSGAVTIEQRFEDNIIPENVEGTATNVLYWCDDEATT